jgi:uncharacterized coiled-coil protein SlyX
MNLPPKPYGSSTRGVTLSDVSHAADTLLRAGERPTVEKIRTTIGSGSPNTVGPLLDAWWKRLAGRIEAGPVAFHRLPESVAHVAEALWMQALDEGRRRALMEQRMTDSVLAHDKERLELRSHVLTLREGELDSRLRDRERQYASLEIQLRELTVLMRKAEASRDAQTQRVAALEEELSVMRQSRSKPRRQSPPHPIGAERRQRPAKARRAAIAGRSATLQKAISRKRPR